MNILITGASGFVGRALTDKLLFQKDKIFLISKDRNFKSGRAKVFYGDLNDGNFCRKIVKNIDLVYYLAGYKKNIAHHIKYPNDFVFGNIKPIFTFLEAIKDSAVKKIIYLSSTNVGFYKEGEEDGYIIGKYISELILKSFSGQFNIDVKIVRASGIYGPGDNFDLKVANFIPAIINKIFESTGEILVWGSGKRKVQFIFIEDIVSNLVAISNSPDKFFIIGNPESLTVNNIVKKIVKLSGRNLVIKNDLTKPDKQTVLFKFNNERKPKFNLEKGLKKTIDYYKKIIKYNAENFNHRT